MQERLVQNQELSIAEPGGQHDAVGLVSLLAHMQAEDVVVSRRAASSVWLGPRARRSTSPQPPTRS